MELEASEEKKNGTVMWWKVDEIVAVSVAMGKAKFFLDWRKNTCRVPGSFSPALCKCKWV